MLLAFMSRVAGATANEYVRQALATFGVDALATTPRSTGTTACDTNGVALMGRLVHGTGKVGSAPIGAGEMALDAYETRDEAIVQNVDFDGGGYLLTWLEGAPVAKFVVPPGESFTWKGADKILVAGLAGPVPYVAVER